MASCAGDGDRRSGGGPDKRKPFARLGCHVEKKNSSTSITLEDIQFMLQGLVTAAEEGESIPAGVYTELAAWGHEHRTELRLIHQPNFREGKGRLSTSHYQSYLPSMVLHVAAGRTVNNNNACDRCRNDLGHYRDCVLFTMDSRALMDGACTNCFLDGSAARCNLSTATVTPRTRRTATPQKAESSSSARASRTPVYVPSPAPTRADQVALGSQIASVSRNALGAVNIRDDQVTIDGATLLAILAGPPNTQHFRFDFATGRWESTQHDPGLPARRAPHNLSGVLIGSSGGGHSREPSVGSSRSSGQPEGQQESPRGESRGSSRGSSQEVSEEF
ncbi:MAG: hypothetical protein Q9165_008053 [Trypethelium subeluteriae]